jgi:hypothetical protein
LIDDRLVGRANPAREIGLREAQPAAKAPQINLIVGEVA